MLVITNFPSPVQAVPVFKPKGIQGYSIRLECRSE